MEDSGRIDGQIDSSDTTILDQKGSMGKLLLYVILLFMLWVIRIDLYHLIDDSAPTDFIQFYVSNYLRLLFWTVPLLLFFLAQAPNWLRMFGLRPFKIFDAFSVSLLLLELALAIFLDVQFQPAAITDKVWLKVGSIIVIGPFVEELSFRGYIFPEIRAFSNALIGTIFSSSLFVLIHFPIWIHNAVPAHEMAVSSIVAFAFGSLSCFVVQRTKSLYPSFALHGLNNLIVQFLAG